MIPLPFILGWQMISAFFTASILPLVRKIPWQVWAVVGVVVAFMFYGSYREHKGYRKCEIKTEQAAQKEIARQAEVAKSEVAKAKLREADANRRLEQVSKELDNVNEDVAKLKEANKVCLPKSVTDKFRRVR